MELRRVGGSRRSALAAVSTPCSARLQVSPSRIRCSWNRCESAGSANSLALYCHGRPARGRAVREKSAESGLRSARSPLRDRQSDEDQPCCLPRHPEWVVRELELDGASLPRSWGLPRPSAKSDDGRMPTSRRQRSNDHRLIALVRETGDTSITRARGAPTARRRPRVEGRNSDTDEPNGAASAVRPSPGTGTAAPTARPAGTHRPPASLGASPRPPNVSSTRTSHSDRSDTYPCEVPDMRRRFTPVCSMRSRSPARHALNPRPFGFPSPCGVARPLHRHTSHRRLLRCSPLSFLARPRSMISDLLLTSLTMSMNSRCSTAGIRIATSPTLYH